MADLISMVCPPGVGCPLASLGLPEVLLWVLTFAVVFAMLTKTKIFSRAPAALVSIAVGFLVLMAVPAALIGVIASMSTGLITLVVAVLVLISLIEVVRPSVLVGKDDKGNPVFNHWFTQHSTATGVVIVIIAAMLFFASGGAALLGFSLPAFSIGNWLLVLVGIAVLWMLSETK